MYYPGGKYTRKLECLKIFNQCHVQQAMRHSKGRRLDDLYVVCFSGIPQCTDRDKELKKGVEDPWGCHFPHPLSNPDDDGGSPLPSAECNESVTALLLPVMQHKTISNSMEQNSYQEASK